MKTLNLLILFLIHIGVTIAAAFVINADTIAIATIYVVISHLSYELLDDKPELREADPIPTPPAKNRRRRRYVHKRQNGEETLDKGITVRCTSDVGRDHREGVGSTD